MPEETSFQETLDQTIARAASTLTKSDLETIVAGLREQRARWNFAQQTGSRKRSPSSSIPTVNIKPKTS